MPSSSALGFSVALFWQSKFLFCLVAQSAQFTFLIAVPLQVRQLASAAAQDGTVDAAAVKFVRHQKTTLIELQRRAAEKAQQILEKQVR